MSDARVMIRCKKLCKNYGPTRAVDNVSFEVRSGEILGFLGPNGAGKTTTMKMLTSFLAPSSGTAHVAGFNVNREPLDVRQRVGYLPEDTPLYKDMRVLEYLDYVTELRGLKKSERRPRIKKIGEVTGIMDVLGKPIGALSKGFRQRVGLTQAIVHDPDILLLDEPTSGLDPNQIVEIRRLIKDLGKEKTVILSTHILPEVQATCDRVVIISDGKLVADGRPNELVAQETSDKYRVLLGDAGAAKAGPYPDTTVAVDAVRDKLQGIDGVKSVSAENTEDGVQFLVIGQSGGDLRRALFECATDQKWPLLELDRRQVSLEEVFGRLTRTEDNKNKEPAKAA